MAAADVVYGQCGPKPFAIVTREWTHDNQSVPEHLELVRREDAPPAIVKGMTLTTSFKNVNSTRCAFNCD